MADSTDALIAIIYELTATHQLQLEPAALSTCREIFEKTIGNFAKQAADKNVPEHPWDNAQFREFILGQVKRIAVQAKEAAKSGPVSSELLRTTAITVMRKTNRVCRIRAERGHLSFGTSEKPKHLEGEVCSAFLEADSTPSI